MLHVKHTKPAGGVASAPPFPENGFTTSCIREIPAQAGQRSSGAENRKRPPDPPRDSPRGVLRKTPGAWPPGAWTRWAEWAPVHPPPCHAAKPPDPRGPEAAPQGRRTCEGPPAANGDCPSGRPRSPGRKAERTSSEARATSDVEGGTGPRGGPTDLRRRRPSRVGAGSAPDPHTGPSAREAKASRADKAALATRRRREVREDLATDAGVPERGPRGRRTGRLLATRGPAWGARPARRRTGVARPRSAGTGGRTGPSQHPQQETRKGLPGWLHLLARASLARTGIPIALRAAATHFGARHGPGARRPPASPPSAPLPAATDVWCGGLGPDGLRFAPACSGAALCAAGLPATLGDALGIGPTGAYATVACACMPPS